MIGRPRPGRGRLRLRICARPDDPRPPPRSEPPRRRRLLLSLAACPACCWPPWRLVAAWACALACWPCSSWPAALLTLLVRPCAALLLAPVLCPVGLAGSGLVRRAGLLTLRCPDLVLFALALLAVAGLALLAVLCFCCSAVAGLPIFVLTLDRLVASGSRRPAGPSQAAEHPRPAGRTLLGLARFRGRSGLVADGRRLLAGRLGDFSIDLIGEIFELALRTPQGGRFVAQHAPGGAFDSLAHLADPLAGMPRRLGRIVGDSQVRQLLGRLECIRDLVLGRLSDRVVQILGQKRLGLLGVLHGVAHLIEELVEILLLLAQPCVAFFRSPVSRSEVWG